MWISIDIETYKVYQGTKESEEKIISEMLSIPDDDSNIKWFRENKKKGYMYPVLNSQEFKIGGALTDEGEYKEFTDPEEMYAWLCEKIEKNAENGKKTYVYGHNLQYDWNGIAQNHHWDENIEKICDYPLLITYFCKGKEKKYKNWGWFVDTMGFFPQSLEEVGESFGFKKMEMPKEIKDVSEISEYLKRDCEITLKSLIELRNSIEEIGFRPRKFLTAGTVAMTTFMTYIRKYEEYWDFMKSGEVFKGEKLEKCRPAYRGARVEAFRKGNFKNCTYIDINSLYPYIMSTMPFPKLDEEMYLEDPLEDMSLKEILNKKSVGVMECEVECPKTDMGYLPIRYDKKMHFPTDCKLSGTWTTMEIRKAIKLGYKVKKVKWVILYPVIERNLFENYLLKMYEMRKEASGTKKIAIKLLMNNLYGKFGQFRVSKEYKMIERFDLSAWIEKGWFKQSTYKEKYIIAKYRDVYKPKYTNLMIALMITAYARDKLYSELMKVKKEDRLYCDTDCIIYKGEYKDVFNIGDRMGEFKVVDKGNCFIGGEKRYYFNDEVKISGVPKKIMNKKMVEEDSVIKMKRIISLGDAIRNPELMDKIGQFIEVEKEYKSKIKGDTIFPSEIDERKEWVEIFD